MSGCSLAEINEMKWNEMKWKWWNCHCQSQSIFFGNLIVKTADHLQFWFPSLLISLFIFGAVFMFQVVFFHRIVIIFGSSWNFIVSSKVIGGEIQNKTKIDQQLPQFLSTTLDKFQLSKDWGNNLNFTHFHSFEIKSIFQL